MKGAPESFITYIGLDVIPTTSRQAGQRSFEQATASYTEVITPAGNSTVDPHTFLIRLETQITALD